MKVWLLLIYITGGHEGGFDAIEFRSKQSCEAAKSTPELREDGLSMHPHMLDGWAVHCEVLADELEPPRHHTAGEEER